MPKHARRANAQSVTRKPAGHTSKAASRSSPKTASPARPKRDTTPVPALTAPQRASMTKWLLELTAIPTAAGREHRVMAWIDQWLAARADRLLVQRDDAGNYLITRRDLARGRGTIRGPGGQSTSGAQQVLMTAHLDHPAFVVTRVERGRVHLEFRGGVLDAYFARAPLEAFDAGDGRHALRIERTDLKATPFKTAVAVPTGSAAAKAHALRELSVGDIARWRWTGSRGRDRARVAMQSLPSLVPGGRPRRVKVFETHACDDLAAAAIALAVLDASLAHKDLAHLGLVLTVAEEVGFIGAIHAARNGFIPKRALLLNLENSRSYPHDSPIGAGAILRIGDRATVFDAGIVNGLSAEFGRLTKADPTFTCQRKLMPGGWCETTAFGCYGYRSVCLCLPLGNYHNMESLERVEAGRGPARMGPECVSVDDCFSLTRMLFVAASILKTPVAWDGRATMETLYAQKKRVLTPCSR